MTFHNHKSNHYKFEYQVQDNPKINSIEPISCICPSDAAKNNKEMPSKTLMNNQDSHQCLKKLQQSKGVS